MDLEVMLSEMKLEYDFDGTSVLAKSVARKLTKGYSGRLKESVIREVALEYAELFDSVCKDPENSWLKLKFYVIRFKLDTLLVERLLCDYLKRCRLHMGLLSKDVKKSYYVKQARVLLEEIEKFGNKKVRVFEHIETAISRYRLKSSCEFHSLERDLYKLRERLEFKHLLKTLEKCKVELNNRLCALGVGLFISSASDVKVSGSKAEERKGFFL